MTTVLGGGVKDFVTTVLKSSLNTKSITMGSMGIKNCLKLRDVNYGRPLTFLKCHIILFPNKIRLTKSLLQRKLELMQQDLDPNKAKSSKTAEKM